MGQKSPKILDPIKEDQIGDLFYPQLDNINQHKPNIVEAQDTGSTFFNMPTSGGSE